MIRDTPGERYSYKYRGKRGRDFSSLNYKSINAIVGLVPMGDDESTVGMRMKYFYSSIGIFLCFARYINLFAENAFENHS